MKTQLVMSILSAALAFAFTGEAVQSLDEDLFKLKGKGFVAAIDCRTGGSSGDYAEGLAEIKTRFSVVVSNFTGKAFSLANASDQLRTSGGNVAVYIVDDPTLPLALSASEERWSLVNAAKCKVDSPSEAVFRRRMSLLFARQCCRVLGSDEAKECDTCFHVVLGVKDLDAITSFDITMGPEMAINGALPVRGIEVEEFGSYEEACEAGVAPPPKNAEQKKIWDKVHALPTQPIRILPEKRK